jgi:hypothetical protein
LKGCTGRGGVGGGEEAVGALGRAASACKQR